MVLLKLSFENIAIVATSARPSSIASTFGSVPSMLSAFSFFAMPVPSRIMRGYMPHSFWVMSPVATRLPAKSSNLTIFGSVATNTMPDSPITPMMR